MTEPKTYKKSTAKGRRIGLKDNPTISLEVNDPTRTLSHLWELVKTYYSHHHIPAPEAARVVLELGLTNTIERIMILRAKEETEQHDRKQMRLFE